MDMLTMTDTYKTQVVNSVFLNKAKQKVFIHIILFILLICRFRKFLMKKKPILG